MEKTRIIANPNCNECGLNEPVCEGCGKDIIRVGNIIFCEGRYTGNKHLCNTCGKKRLKRLMGD